MNAFINMIKSRRTIYGLNKNMPVADEVVCDLVRDCVRYVPDAFDMKSQRVIVCTGEKHEQFWNSVYDELVKFTGDNLSRERTDSFSAGHGTILYFYDSAVMDSAKKQYAQYAERFHDWIMQSNGMLQFAVWTGLRALGVGANLQHYNPVIDEMVKKMFNVPESWVLVAQMPFGGIEKEPDAKAEENISNRVKIEK